MKIDRSETARALAKTIAYLGCGRHDDAKHWFCVLASLLGFANMLREEEEWKCVTR